MEYYAHYCSETETYQTVLEHHKGTAKKAKEKNPIPEIEHLLELACRIHDMGKLSMDWQEYFQKAINYPNITQRKKNHTTLGGQLALEILGTGFASEMVQLAIYSHHGLKDVFIETDKGIKTIFVEQKQRAQTLPFAEAKAAFYHDLDIEKSDFEDLAEKAKIEATELGRNIIKTWKNWGNSENEKYGNAYFYLGLYERMLISLLIDADRRDTEDFMSQNRIDISNMESFWKDKKSFWKQCIDNVEGKIGGLKPESELYIHRKKISDICRKMAKSNKNLYQLSVPTGAGKTLSSLLFAVHHAYRYDKSHIIYIAPFNSILEQNAEEIRKAVGSVEMVLEHHYNLVIENEDEQERYNRLIEDWYSPIVVTTAVQFLNALFDGKPTSVRKLHSLCNSVIIVDEVQAFPIKVFELFNLAVNYLTNFTNTTVILCTATQPLLGRLPENALRPAVEMVPSTEISTEAFKRVVFVDKTKEVKGGMEIEQAAQFLWERAVEHRSVLFIGNTKDCVRNLFQALKEKHGEDAILFHLSTNMCPENREEVLKKLIEILDNEKIGKPIICVSSQVIEAGINISFQSVVRSLAGLDSLIQAAGRCNRHKKEKLKLGKVYLVKLSENAEKLDKLQEIKRGQQVMESILREFEKKPEKFGGSLDSKITMNMYYDSYLSKSLLQTSYSIPELSSNAVEMLSKNKVYNNKGRKGLTQAFATVGEKFEVIEDCGKIGVIVEYSEKAKELLKELQASHGYADKKQILKKLQRFAVNLSKWKIEKLMEKDALYFIMDNSVMVLKERFYSKEVGVVENPAPMKLLNL